MKRRKRRQSGASIEASYVCDVCGEEIAVSVDRSAGESQEFVEDCPVCCRPQMIRIELDEHGEVRIWSLGEAN